VVRGALVGAALLAAGIAGWGTVGPALESARWRAELLRSEPPSALPVPVEGVEPGDLGDTWGEARSGGRSHEGIDIFARRRTPVRSTTPGLVVRRGENPLGGRTVTILGPGGWRHYYAHLQGYAGHSTGDRVAPGEVIGFVGTSGNAPADAPHLHYGIYDRRGARNPYPLLVPGAAGPEAESSGTAHP
jgi:murein DD-endopeptidase MepM/ murein hydrolase activator NlpD